MRDDELDVIKRALRRLEDSSQELWLEKQLLRNLILDSGWMREPELDAAIERGKALPENRDQVRQQCADSDELLARIGIGDWLAALGRRYPRID